MDDMRLKVHGDAQVIPGLERIVRALAAEEAPIDSDYQGCRLCGQLIHDRLEGDRFGIAEYHKPACPWRMAREWVEANPA
jgi:hypothetical protein